MQYNIAAYFSKKSFFYLLIIKNCLSLDKLIDAQYFVFNCYIKIIFENIIFNTGTAKVLTTDKNQFKVL